MTGPTPIPATPVRAFAPGEIFLFGEHAVVYGRTGVAAAIERGVEVTLGLGPTGRVVLESDLGTLDAVCEGTSLRVEQASDPLRPHLGGIGRMFERCGRAVPFRARFRSDLPAAAGLASSAASSAALLGALARWCGLAPAPAELVPWVYASEIDIQKRGSVAGSACAVLGGVQRILQGSPEPLGEVPVLPWTVIDTRQPCSTEATTGIVRDRRARDLAGTERLLDGIDALARQGIDALLAGDGARLGELMDGNHRLLCALGVGTPRIDAAVAALRPHVLGVKISGGGGGGCLVALPREGHETALAPVVAPLGCDVFPVRLRREGLVVTP